MKLFYQFHLIVVGLFPSSLNQFSLLNLNTVLYEVQFFFLLILGDEVTIQHLLYDFKCQLTIILEDLVVNHLLLCVHLILVTYQSLSHLRI